MSLDACKLEKLIELKELRQMCILYFQSLIGVDSFS